MHKLEINVRKDLVDPLERKYTLTHSDETGMRFLFIDDAYAEDQYCCHRDEVVADWTMVEEDYVFKISCPLACEASKYSADERRDIFKRHMPRVLQAILGGDIEYIRSNPILSDSPNHIYYYYEEDVYILEEMGKVRDFI